MYIYCNNIRIFEQIVVECKYLELLYYFMLYRFQKCIGILAFKINKYINLALNMMYYFITVHTKLDKNTGQLSSQVIER